MIPRYSREKMQKIFEPENKFRIWLDIELGACEAHAELGNIPKDSLKTILKKADFEIDRIDEIEKETNHDVIAFLTAVAEKVGPDSRFIHMGLTSSDIGDTALAYQMMQACAIIEDDIKNFMVVLEKRAKDTKEMVCIGRTHGVHAEPMVFGLKFALWYEEMGRQLKRIQAAKENISICKLSGAVGTYANIDPLIEEYVAKRLGLTPTKIATQILQRDRHAEVLLVLANIAGSLDKIAVEIRALQKTEFYEVEEPFGKGQKGSSAMPHKKNPITCERVSGLSRVIKANANVALDNITLWHERDISHSSAERVVVPDSFTALDYIFDKLTWVIDGLVVHPENMLRNLNSMGGLVYSQKLLLKLVKSGITREDAYIIVQSDAMEGRKGDKTFYEIAKNDARILEHLSKDEIEETFDYKYDIRNVDMIYDRIFG